VEPKHINTSGENLYSNNVTRSCSLLGQTQKVQAGAVYSVVDQKVDLKFNDKGGANQGSVLFKLYSASGRHAGDKAEVSLYCSFRDVHSTFQVLENANQQLSPLFAHSR
jgi:hypothetical protein